MNRLIVAVSAVALLAGACSTQTAHESEPESSTHGDAGSTASKTAGQLGDTLDLTRADGSKIAVTLTQIINPATVSDGNAEDGKTYVATKLTIVDIGSTEIEGAVNVNVSLIGSDGQSYPADLNDVAECTNFDAGTFHLGAGESAAGCVVFALPNGVTPAKVRYKPSAGFADDSGEWLVS